jgi:hypothetical protein
LEVRDSSSGVKCFVIFRCFHSSLLETAARNRAVLELCLSLSYFATDSQSVSQSVSQFVLALSPLAVDRHLQDDVMGRLT